MDRPLKSTQSSLAIFLLSKCQGESQSKLHLTPFVGMHIWRDLKPEINSQIGWLAEDKRILTTSFARFAATAYPVIGRFFGVLC